MSTKRKAGTSACITEVVTKGPRLPETPHLDRIFGRYEVEATGVDPHKRALCAALVEVLHMDFYQRMRLQHEVEKMQDALRAAEGR